MALSLQDQLLKAGLTDKKKANQAKKAIYKKAEHKRKHKVEEVDEVKQAAEKARAEKIAKDKKLNLSTKEVAEKKAVKAQTKQLIELNKQPKGKGDIACNFPHNNLVKRLYVDQKTQNRISQGKLAIVSLGDGYEIVPTPVADKISLRDKHCVVYTADAKEQAEAANQASEEENDWYADFDIPDDMAW